MKTVDHVRNVATVLLILVIIGMLAACTGAGPLVNVPTAVPVECREQEPERPLFNLERLKAAGCTAAECLDAFVAAATADKILHDGYERRLVTALRACIAPITP